MGKRKRSRSNSSDYDSILRKFKKLEHKLRKKQKQRDRSLSSEPDLRSERGNAFYEVDADLQGEEVHDEIMDEEVIDIQDDCPVQSAPSEPIADACQLVTSLDEPAEPSVNADQQITPSVDDITPPLEPEILQLLGEDPTNQKSYGQNLHKDIASRWAHILSNGLPKDTQSELIKCYLPSENCSNMRAPILNLEIKAALNEINAKKDLYSQSKQNQLASSLAAIGEVLNWAFSSKNVVPQNIIKALSDAGRLICDSHYRESLSRRFTVLNTLNKDVRDTIKNTKIDEYLFGSGLTEHIKSSKAIDKTGSEMKPMQRTSYKAPPATQPQRGALNLRGAPRGPVADSRAPPAPRRPPPRDRRQDAQRGRRYSAYTRQQARRR